MTTYTGVKGTIGSLYLDGKVRACIQVEEMIENAVETWPEMTVDDEIVITEQIIQSLRDGIDEIETSVLDYLRQVLRDRRDQ